ncbi:ATP-dependent transcriptional regulator [Maritimibacter sp. 55A14]|uniref:DUF2927 domain-containing protein n=1 Tax=Maritimibacter sp. 55A14 TaxID=2174844 RepID=UPI000D60F163|nr:DUF2927 domain-containing protein [Maritimibacter sp. 55A14]PWE33987.1 ATP-dependent transcriptional regulator [Maritimibacter sp. 55A14]
MLPCLVVLAGCGLSPSADVSERHAHAPGAALPMTLPEMKLFGTPPRETPARANADIARDFLDLAFEMESGRAIPRLTRFTEPVTVAVVAGAPDSLRHDLDRLMARLTDEAGISMRHIRPGETPNIVIETLPRRELQRAVPQAACFVVPRVSSWAEFLRNRRGGQLDWTTLARRERTAIFIPADVSPQEVRDCLHEEIAQALGPLNDLYRLPDSIFNDDNFHTVLTGFDMLILRAYYAPEIRNGMTRDQVAQVLPRVLARLNPRGERIAPEPLPRTSRAWIEAMETALGPKVSSQRRLTSARRALSIARQEEWLDNRLGFSLFAFGRLALTSDTPEALSAFAAAHALYRSLYGPGDIHAAHVSMQLAAFALSSGQAEAAVELVNDSLPAVSRGQNAALLATLLMIKSEALGYLGRADEAQIVRLDSLGWARYGFGSAKAVRQRVSEITALTPKRSKTGA